MHTEGPDTGSDEVGEAMTEEDNQITIQFQALLVPTGRVEDTDYFITAGAEYGDEQFVWVGQEKVTVHRRHRVII